MEMDSSKYYITTVGAVWRKRNSIIKRVTAWWGPLFYFILICQRLAPLKQSFLLPQEIGFQTVIWTAQQWVVIWETHGPVRIFCRNDSSVYRSSKHVTCRLLSYCHKPTTEMTCELLVIGIFFFEILIAAVNSIFILC